MTLKTHYDILASRRGKALCGTGAASVNLTRKRAKVDCKRCLRKMAAKVLSEIRRAK